MKVVLILALLVLSAHACPKAFVQLQTLHEIESTVFVKGPSISTSASHIGKTSWSTVDGISELDVPYGSKLYIVMSNVSPPSNELLAMVTWNGK